MGLILTSASFRGKLLILNPKSIFFSLLYHKGVTKNKHNPPFRLAGLSGMGSQKDGKRLVDKHDPQAFGYSIFQLLAKSGST
jgi:hypothetical protein